MNSTKMCLDQLTKSVEHNESFVQDKVNYLELCKGISVSSLITLITPANYSI